MKKKEPWNDQNAPMSKNGAKWALIITIGLVVSISIVMMLFAYFANK